MASAGAATTSFIMLKTSSIVAAVCVMLVLSSVWQPAAATDAPCSGIGCAVDPNCKKCVDGCMMVADASCSGIGCTVPVVNQTCRDQQFNVCGSSCFRLCTIIPPSP